MTTKIRHPVMKGQCLTCPFKDGSKYGHLQTYLAMSALSEASRICHSTGSNNGINRRTGIKPHLCRGARDLQLKFFATIGFISTPTDEAWETKCKEMGIK